MEVQKPSRSQTGRAGSGVAGFEFPEREALQLCSFEAPAQRYLDAEGTFKIQLRHDPDLRCDRL